MKSTKWFFLVIILGLVSGCWSNNNTQNEEETAVEKDKNWEEEEEEEEDWIEDTEIDTLYWEENEIEMDTVETGN